MFGKAGKTVIGESKTIKFSRFLLSESKHLGLDDLVMQAEWLFKLIL